MIHKISVLFFSVTLTLSVFAQKPDAEGYIQTASGLKYKVTQKGTGSKPVAGAKITAHYTGRLTNDTVFDSSVKRGQPFSFKLGKGMVIKGWDEGFALLNKGDKATLIIPPDLGYGARNAGKIPPNSTLIFDVELIDWQEPWKPVPFEVKGKDTLKTASGLQIIMVDKKPGGVPTQSGKKVMMNYTGYLLDGSHFDSSVERNQPFPFVLGQGQVIKGWDEAVAMLKEGEKARLIIPHQLGYGERGYPPIIPANATLVFDVEVVKAIVD